MTEEIWYCPRCREHPKYVRVESFPGREVNSRKDQGGLRVRCPRCGTACKETSAPPPEKEGTA